MHLGTSPSNSTADNRRSGKLSNRFHWAPIGTAPIGAFFGFPTSSPPPVGSSKARLRPRVVPRARATGDSGLQSQRRECAERGLAILPQRAELQRPGSKVEIFGDFFDGFVWFSLFRIFSLVSIWGFSWMCLTNGSCKKTYKESKVGRALVDAYPIHCLPVGLTSFFWHNISFNLKTSRF